MHEYCNLPGCDVHSLGGCCPVLRGIIVRESSGPSRPGNLLGLLEEEGNITLETSEVFVH